MFNCERDVDLYIGTLSKALSCQGGFIACSKRLKLLTQSTGRTFIFSTALPVPVAAAAHAAVIVAEKETWRRRAIQNLIRDFHALTGVPITSAIISLIVGTEENAQKASRHLLRSGFHVIAIRTPVVPPNSCRCYCGKQKETWRRRAICSCCHSLPTGVPITSSAIIPSMDKLPKCEANYAPLSPISFLKRASAFYANRTSVIYESTRFTWRQTYDRCCRLASSLRSLNILKNDVVSVLAPNIPAMYEMHFAVPMAGAVLNTINTRLDAKNISTILRHSEAKLFFVDYQYVPLALEALRLLMGDSKSKGSSSDSDDDHAAESSSIPLVIVINDIESPTGVRPGELEYEQLVQKGNPTFFPCVKDELDPIALNYTSGTTSEPKGVVYSHRGAYLSTLSLILGWEMGSEPVYLWTLPMFHCNGWTFTWGVAARGGTNVCLRNTVASEIYKNIALHKVTHMCCAPIVFNVLLQANPSDRRRLQDLTSPVQIFTGGAPPPAALLEKIEPLGFHVTHGYGLTEATGPALICEWQTQWNRLPRDDQAKLKARQGISVLTLDDVDVKDLETMANVPHDGKTVGEIVLRGSSLMKGYFKDQKATSKAFKDGCWFLTGDVGVVHPDGYIEIKDRSKDVIISGGENISSVEVESVLYRHPRVVEAAVVAMPHPHWGESPCAFVVIKNNSSADNVIDEAEIISYCRKNLPHFMVPKKVAFLPDLPKNSTGKVLKAELRAKANGLVVSHNLSDQILALSSRL